MGPMATTNTPTNTPISTECSGCGELITDRFILQVAGRSWHAHCLRCCVCHTLLDGHASCFLRDEQLYCKLDYTKLFGAKCYKCGRMISPADWVRKAKDQVGLIDLLFMKSKLTCNASEVTFHYTFILGIPFGLFCL